MKKLWIVTELFYPEETSTAFILTKIANALSDKFDVNVICGPESYGRAALEDNLSPYFMRWQLRIREQRIICGYDIPVE